MGQAKQRGTFEHREAAAKLKIAEQVAAEKKYVERVKSISAELGVELIPMRPIEGGLVWVSVAQLEALAETMRPYLADALAAKAVPACPCGPECECGVNEAAERPAVPADEPPADAAPVPDAGLLAVTAAEPPDGVAP
jgi:hypothetical protein